MNAPESPTAIRVPAVADVPQLAEVHLAAWLAAYRGVCDDSFLDSLTQQTFEQYHRGRFDASGSPDPDQPFVVACDENRGRIIGFARAGPTRATSPVGDPIPAGFEARFACELYAIYVDPTRQGQGTGRMLFDALVDRLVERKHASMCLWVLTENRGARAFYERMGGSPTGESIITLGSVRYPQVAYGWEKLG